MGYEINGGFAEYALGYARHVVVSRMASIPPTRRR